MDVLDKLLGIKKKRDCFRNLVYGGPQGIRTPDLLVRSSAKAASLSDFYATYHIAL